jgi:hypothetical protein
MVTGNVLKVLSSIMFDFPQAFLKIFNIFNIHRVSHLPTPPCVMTLCSSACATFSPQLD